MGVGVGMIVNNVPYSERFRQGKYFAISAVVPSDEIKPVTLFPLMKAVIVVSAK